MTEQLFSMPEPVLMGPANPWRPCKARGGTTDWLHPNRYRTTPEAGPRCNRPEGHGGDHIRWNRSARQLARWPNEKVVMG
jgi:hypothetical protein